MYPINQVVAEALRRPDRDFMVKAVIAGKEYNNTVIVDFNIENSMTSLDGFELGTAIPSKLVITLRTSDEIPSNAKVVPYVSISFSSMTWQGATFPWKDAHFTWQGASGEWIPMGEFFVDSREKINGVWTYTCYDKLVFADAAYISSLSYPVPMKAVWDEICTRLGYVYDSSVVINPSYQIQAGPAGYTMRQVLGYIAGANSANVIVGKDGMIRFRRFTAASQPVFNMDTADYVRVKQTNPIKSYSRIVVTYNTEDQLTYEAGTGDENHTLTLENPFMTQTMVNNLQNALNGFSYIPISMDARGFPQLEVGDILGFEQYEGVSWIEAVTPWKDMNIPWNGMVKYQSVILRQTFGFQGGLKMAIEAPSISDQQSEFKVDGSLTTAVNNLNKTAIKEGKPYYGVTITRTEGLIVEREDHASKAVFNSDELAFYAGGEEVLYFDIQDRTFKFAGELEAAGGTFTGTLRGADGIFTGTLRAGVVEGSEIYGSYIATSEDDYPRCELNPDSNLFGAYFDSENYVAIMPDNNNSPALVFFANGMLAGFIDASFGFNFSTTGNAAINAVLGYLEVNTRGNINLNSDGYVVIPSWDNLRSRSDGESLQDVIDEINARIDALK